MDAGSDLQHKILDYRIKLLFGPDTRSFHPLLLKDKTHLQVAMLSKHQHKETNPQQPRVLIHSVTLHSVGGSTPSSQNANVFFECRGRESGVIIPAAVRSTAAGEEDERGSQPANKWPASRHWVPKTNRLRSRLFGCRVCFLIMFAEVRLHLHIWLFSVDISPLNYIFLYPIPYFLIK